MYRIWDVENKVWVNQPDKNNSLDSFFIVTPDEQIFYVEQKSNKFNSKVYYNVYPTEEGAYFYHNDTQIYDVEENLVFEGDIVECDGHVYIVSYFDVIAGFALVDLTSNDAFPLRPNAHKVKIIGNVFEDQDIIADAEHFDDVQEITMTVDYYVREQEGEKDE